jgi:hypothetical protein
MSEAVKTRIRQERSLRAKDLEEVPCNLPQETQRVGKSKGDRDPRFVGDGWCETRGGILRPRKPLPGETYHDTDPRDPCRRLRPDFFGRHEAGPVRKSMVSTPNKVTNTYLGQKGNTKYHSPGTRLVETSDAVDAGDFSVFPTNIYGKGTVIYLPRQQVSKIWRVTRDDMDRVPGGPKDPRVLSREDLAARGNEVPPFFSHYESPGSFPAPRGPHPGLTYLPHHTPLHQGSERLAPDRFYENPLVYSL